VSTPEPPPVPPEGAPTEPVTAVSPRSPRVPPPPPPGAPATEAPLLPPEGPYPPDPRGAWWQQEAAIIAVGLLMLVAGGLLGYVIGHSHAKTRTVPRGSAVVAAPPATTTAPGATQTLTTSTTVTTPAKGQTRTTQTRTRTVVAKARTVTLPAKTVTVAAPPKVIHSTTTQTITTTTTTTTATSGSAGGGSQTFTGSANETLGTIQVATASQLRWSCSGCASATFDVTSSSSDPTPLAVHGQNAASGQVAVAAGSYTSVAVQATGSWTFTISAS
jgi:hypothetical protein